MLTNGLCGTSEIKVLASGDIELLHNTSGDKFKEVTSPLPALARPGMLTSDLCLLPPQGGTGRDIVTTQ